MWLAVWNNRPYNLFWILISSLLTFLSILNHMSVSPMSVWLLFINILFIHVFLSNSNSWIKQLVAEKIVMINQSQNYSCHLLSLL